ncbi:MAG: Hsp20/alpha crystallin family protein [Candidatus Yanofskybacteria bacterium]|nr:Hsp20/alpha crystallin family protein [Candidatus Yanofskybacteria bacterium]
MPYTPNDEELDIQLAASRKDQEQPEGSLTVDVYRDEGDIVIQSTIAGATAADIDISILNDMVTIKGSRSPESKVRSQNYYYQELYWGPFSRSIILPEEVDADGAKASMKNGILTIRLPTLEKAKTKRLKIELK